MQSLPKLSTWIDVRMHRAAQAILGLDARTAQTHTGVIVPQNEHDLYRNQWKTTRSAQAYALEPDCRSTEMH